MIYFISLFLLTLAACGNARKPARLQGFDVLALPGRPLVLRAKVESFGLLGSHPDQKGETIAFFLGKQKLGTARSADEGIATLRWTPPQKEPHTYELTAALTKASHYTAPPAKLYAFVRDPTRPVLVVDIDHTICDASALAVLRNKDPRRLPTLPGSVAALKKLSQRYDLIYLSARDDALTARSRAWLDLKGFPKGPLLVRDIGLLTLSAERYKRKRLQALQRDFNLVAGVGDREDDADAYLAAGMRALLIGKGRTPKGARRYPDWPAIQQALGR